MKALLFVLAASLHLAAESAAEPEDLTQLRNDWKKSREKVLEPIDRKYMTALETLKNRLTKAGDLGAALEVDKELKILMNSPTAGFKGQVTPELLAKGEWRFDNKAAKYTTHFTFTPTGEIFERGKKTATGNWKIKGSRLRLEFKDAWNEFEIGFEGEVTLIEKDSSAGKRSGVSLTQASVS